MDCAKTMELALPRCEITILSDFYIFEKNYNKKLDVRS
jgi:hypothetical protein